MDSQTLIAKYHLPTTVHVSVTRDADGSYVVTFPEQPGCMTVTESAIDVIAIADALLTYFDVPPADACRATYLPQRIEITYAHSPSIASRSHRS
jgi:hypothetical protein